MANFLPPVAAALAAAAAPDEVARAGADVPSPSPMRGDDSASEGTPGATEDRRHVPGRTPADSPADARGRRLLSTAFVRVGPDAQLTVQSSDGRTLVLRDVVMNRGDYCGTLLAGGPAGKRYCGRYADVAAARAGGMPAADPAPAAPDIAVRPAPLGDGWP